MLPAGRYSDLVLGVSAIENQLDTWISRGDAGVLQPVRGSDSAIIDPVGLIWRALSECRDEYPPASTAELLFIADKNLRDSIRRDVGAATLAFHNAEWKGATVLAGAAIEALLHWKLGEPPQTAATLKAAGQAVVAKGGLKNAPSPDVDRWGLQEFIEIAGELKVIKPETVIAADLARNFRNLIHPGASARLAAVCDRATALSALAGMEHVIRDL